MSSRTPHVGISIDRIMATSLALLLLSLSCVVSPVTSFLLPRQQSLQQQHQPPIVLPSPSPLPISSEDGQRSLLYQSPQSQDGNAATTTAGTSKRAQRKAAQRAKKQRQQTQTSNNINKVTSQHPEAIIKRQKQQGNNNNTNSKRRNHNFAQRAEYLSEGTDEQFGFNDNLDQLTLTTIPKTQGDTTIEDKAANNIQFHQLHSQRVSKLDEETTADDVVKAIKRAQNLHDEHDVVEIAHFLLEEVGELILSVHH